MTDDRARREALLDELYDRVPHLDCAGLCAASCGPIGASVTELERLDAAGVDVTAPRTDLTCPALSTTFGAGRCRVYPIRPMVCRLWGATDAMPCEHGCQPRGGRLSDEDARTLLDASIAVGGADDSRLRALLQALAAGIDDERADADLTVAPRTIP